MTRILTIASILGVAVACMTPDALSHGGTGPPRTSPPPKPKVSPIPQVGSSPGQSGGVTIPPMAGPKTRMGQGPGSGTGRAKPVAGETGGASEVGSEADGFVPGQNGSLAWNTTKPVGERLVLLYVYNLSERKGKSFEFSESFEEKFLKDKRVLEFAKKFCCEKVCREQVGLVKLRDNRAMVGTYLDRLADVDSMKSHIAVLDEAGNVVAQIDDIKRLQKLGTKGFLRTLVKSIRLSLP